MVRLAAEVCVEDPVAGGSTSREAVEVAVLGAPGCCGAAGFCAGCWHPMRAMAERVTAPARKILLFMCMKIKEINEKIENIIVERCSNYN